MRRPLAIGLNRTGRLVAAVGCTAVTAILVAFFVMTNLAARSAERPAGLIIGQPDPGVPGEPPGTDLVAAGVDDVARLLGLCSLPLLALVGYLLIRVLRYDGWLDGTRAYVRGAFRTRSADLSRAQLSVGWRTEAAGPGDGRTRYRTPTLDAYEPPARPLRIPLRGQGMAWLPPPQLEALADAIMAGRSAADPAARIATRLRELAADPFAV